MLKAAFIGAAAAAALAAGASAQSQNWSAFNGDLMAQK